MYGRLSMDPWHHTPIARGRHIQYALRKYSQTHASLQKIMCTPSSPNHHQHTITTSSQHSESVGYVWKTFYGSMAPHTHSTWQTHSICSLEIFPCHYVMSIVHMYEVSDTPWHSCCNAICGLCIRQSWLYVYTI